jgi:integrase/recombinase XerD
MATRQLMLRNKPKADGTLPIAFKIYLGDKSKIITTPFSVLENQWDSTNKRIKSNHERYKVINESLKQLDSRLENVVIDLEAEGIDYNLNDIDTRFRNYSNEIKVKTTTVYNYFQKRIDNLNEIGSFSYAKTIKDSMTSLFKFEKNKELRFKDITFEYLNNYEIFLRKTCENGGIKIKMTDIRTLFNLAIEEGYAKASDYPFKKYSIQKRLKSKPRKIALSEEKFNHLKDFDIDIHKKFTDAYKMFLFSYYVGGMNFKDLAFLKWEYVKNGRLLYRRSKTKQNFNMPITNEAQNILNYYKEYPKTGGIEYVFPIIMRDNLTEKQLYGRYIRCLKIFNKQLKFIAKTVGIEEDLTSYVSRHSMATHLKFNDVSADVISQLMGHSSVSVTNSYLKDFENKVIDDALSKLK